MCRAIYWFGRRSSRRAVAGPTNDYRHDVPALDLISGLLPDHANVDTGAARREDGAAWEHGLYERGHRVRRCCTSVLRVEQVHLIETLVLVHAAVPDRQCVRFSGHQGAATPRGYTRSDPSVLGLSGG